MPRILELNVSKSMPKFHYIFKEYPRLLSSDPPENTTISNSTINVEEGLQPPRVSCSAKAYPEPSYEWRRNGEAIAKGSVLYIYRNMTKADDGPYECVSFNKHGNHSSFTHMNVLCKYFQLRVIHGKTYLNILFYVFIAVKPNCTIARKEINDEDTLVCTAIGNPTEVNLKHLYLNTISKLIYVILVIGKSFNLTYKIIPLMFF